METLPFPLVSPVVTSALVSSNETVYLPAGIEALAVNVTMCPSTVTASKLPALHV